MNSPLNFQTRFSFPLDEFQLEAGAALQAGENVLVCAPTGAGKTVVAEMAIHLAMEQGARVFYTTPLKALSNQKFRDLGALLGEERVGLLTGDVSIQREADVVVMTTEVYRNMLYGTTLGSVESNVEGVRFVILDEVHFMNDAQRGTVWEESIIYSPPNLQLVALSATVANSEDMADWMTRCHRDTRLIETNYRPVPLKHYFFSQGNLSDLDRGPRASDHRPRVDPVTGRRLRARQHQPDADEVLAVLKEKSMLPAIYFVFSRKGCESALVSNTQLSLLNRDQTAESAAFLKAYLAENPGLCDHPHLPYVELGVAAHHAGLLPGWKLLVEKMFQRGLIQAVFATETLAAGINMPARSTVLSNITKRGDEGIRELHASEFLQMSGRAGRRGMDRVGHVVILSGPHHTLQDCRRLASSPPDPLASQFTPTFGMVLNLLQRHTLEEARFLISRSFGEFLEERRLAKRRRAHGRGVEPDEPAPNWIRFLKLRDVLTHYGYLSEDHPTQRGVTASSLRAEHELLVAEALLKGHLDDLSAPELAGVITALVADELRPTATVRLRPSGRIPRRVQDLTKLAREIRMVQNRYRLDLRTRIHSECSGLTQLWADGAEWEEVLRFTNLDEGDLVRLFRRTHDLVQQLEHAPMIDPVFRTQARAAAAAINREPVRESL